jgi:hypothetical protein
MASCFPSLSVALTPASKARAVCGSAARTDLCGGRAALLVPTATRIRTKGTQWMIDCHERGAERSCHAGQRLSEPPEAHGVG